MKTPIQSSALLLPVSALVALCSLSLGQAPGDLSERSWELKGVQRGALVHLPPKAEESAPLVFVFHGHGGNARGTARVFAIHERWPEAIVVFDHLLKSDPLDVEGPEYLKLIIVIHDEMS